MTTYSATSTTVPSASSSVGGRAANGWSGGYDYSRRAYFQDGKLLTGILISLLYLLLATSLDAAGYVQNMTILFSVTIGALTLGLLMAFSRFDGFFALSHSLFTGLAWILFLMARRVTPEEVQPILDNGIPELQAKAYYVLLQWLNWVDAAMSGNAREDNYVFIFQISFLLWWLTYLGVWAIFRYGYTWRAIIPAGIVLLINTYYAPNSILGFLIIFCVLALIMLVRTNLAEQQLRWREQRIYFSPDISLDFLRNGLMYSVMVVALAWIVPGFGRNPQVRAVLEPVNTVWQNTTESLNELYSGLNRQTRPAGSIFGNTLSLGGARNVGNKPVFQVSTRQGRYWRAVVYDTFDGRKWLNTAQEEIRFEANDPVPIPDWQLREPVTHTISLFSPTGGVLFSPPDIIQASIPFEATYDVVPNRALLYSESAAETVGDQAIEFAMARARQPLDVGDSYTVVSRQTAATQRSLRSVPAEYPEAITEEYLQLPENFSPRVAATAEEIIGEEGTVYDKAKTLETWLRGFTYNEEIDAPPPDVDPVEYFLYDIQEGYCDYYATSMVTMLRSQGIPSRMVSGYAEGVLDEESGLYVVTERDAHTWVEVYFPNFGWIEFEPTAGESELNRPVGEDFLEPEVPDPGNRNFPDRPEDFLDDEFDPLLDENLFGDDPNFFGDAQATPAGLPWWLWALITPLLLAVGAFIIFRTRIMGPTSFTPDVPPIIFDKMQLWSQRLGLNPAPEQTPYEQAGRLGRVLPDGKPFIDQITEGYVQYRFGNGSVQAQSAATVNGSGITSAGPTPAQRALPNAWQQLYRIFWRAWMRKFTSTKIRRRNNPFTLVNDRTE